jgi:hypothetical protein
VSHTRTYLYVLNTYLFAYSCTDFSSFRMGTYRVHADSGGLPTLGSWSWTKSHSSTGRFFHCCLAAPLSLFERLGAGGWRLAGGFSCCGSASPDSPPPWWSAVSSTAAPGPAGNAVRTANGRVKDLGFKLGCQWWAAKYSSNPAKFKFRDFIREIKQRTHLAWSWAVQMVTGTSSLSSD